MIKEFTVYSLRFTVWLRAFADINDQMLNAKSMLNNKWSMSNASKGAL